ncbi:MAG TPA: hypothetical protein PK573_12440 [Spirochaetota bacterium]|nr:hypothetical protein [Spirochaetota bacterium]
MNREALAEMIRAVRAEWRSVREARLGRRESLSAAGMDAAAAKKDSEYRRLKKRQRRLSTGLRHLEMKINRIRARDAEEDR